MPKADFILRDGGTSVSFHHQPHEDKMYVSRNIDFKGAAEAAKQMRQNGGARKDIDGFRVVATLPENLLQWADEGKLYGGKYKGIVSADKETQKKLFSAFMQNEGQVYRVNDTKRGHY